MSPYLAGYVPDLADLDPGALTCPASARPWKYNNSVTEYFIETEETSKIKRSDLERMTKETEEAAGGRLRVFKSCPDVNFQLRRKVLYVTFTGLTQAECGFVRFRALGLTVL